MFAYNEYICAYYILALLLKEVKINFKVAKSVACTPHLWHKGEIFFGLSFRNKIRVKILMKRKTALRIFIINALHNLCLFQSKVIYFSVHGAFEDLVFVWFQ